MIKTSWKKSLVIAGVLTALCASAAFAAEQADTKPSMRERVGTILHHDSLLAGLLENPGPTIWNAAVTGAAPCTPARS